MVNIPLHEYSIFLYLRFLQKSIINVMKFSMYQFANLALDLFLDTWFFNLLKIKWDLAFLKQIYLFIYLLTYLLTYLLIWERQRESGVRKGRMKRERNPWADSLVSEEPTGHWGDGGTQSQDPEMVTWGKIRIQMLNWLNHPGAPTLI